jgi:hypothetical protein
MQTKTDIESFVNDWVARNVRVMPRHVSLTQEVDRLAAELTGDARIHGISGGDIHRALGDIDEYLDAQLQARAVTPDAPAV